MSRTRQVPLSTASSSHVQLTSPLTRDDSTVRVSGTLRLRAENDPVTTSSDGDMMTARHIRWGEDVVDNEGMGKKSSKVCCIYHKNRPVGESSSESDDSDSSSDDCNDSDLDTQTHAQRGDRGGDASSKPSSNQPLKRGRVSSCSKRHSMRGSRRKPSPNAYEKMPKVKGQSGKQGT